MKSFANLTYYANAMATLGRVYFGADNGTGFRQIWSTDGTIAGTRLLVDLGDTNDSGPDEVVAAGASLYFHVRNGFTGDQVYRSDGTAAGTTLLPVNGPTLQQGPYAGTSLYALGGAAFLATNVGAGSMIYRAGPGSSTLDALGALGPPSTTAQPLPAAVLANGNILAFGDDGTHGFEPMVVTIPPVNLALTIMSVNVTATVGVPVVLLSASDPDPGQTLTFSLELGSIAGVTIDPVTGVFRFTPAAPGQYQAIADARDNGSPSQAAGALIVIVVSAPLPPANHAPTLASTRRSPSHRARWHTPAPSAPTRTSARASSTASTPGRRPAWRSTRPPASSPTSPRPRGSSRSSSASPTPAARRSRRARACRSRSRRRP